MTSIPPTHLPDTLRHHPETLQTSIDIVQTPHDTKICYILEGIGIRGNIWHNIILYQWIWYWYIPRYPYTPSRYHPDIPRHSCWQQLVVMHYRGQGSGRRSNIWVYWPNLTFCQWNWYWYRHPYTPFRHPQTPSRHPKIPSGHPQT